MFTFREIPLEGIYTLKYGRSLKLCYIGTHLLIFNLTNQNNFVY